MCISRVSDIGDAQTFLPEASICIPLELTSAPNGARGCVPPQSTNVYMY